MTIRIAISAICQFVSRRRRRWPWTGRGRGRAGATSLAPLVQLEGLLVGGVEGDRARDGLPIEVTPPAYCSLPAMQEAGWPGEAVYG